MGAHFDHGRVQMAQNHPENPLAQDSAPIRN
jgi:hypothetical protein